MQNVQVSELDTYEQAEKLFSQLAEKYDLNYAPGRGVMCPWLTTHNVDRVVAYYTISGDGYQAGYVCWRKGEKPKQIEKHDIITFLLL